MLNIYINTWANYNENGADGGEWITLPMEEETLKETMERIASAMEDHDPEWFVNDYEWITEIDLREISEYENIEKLNEWLEELGGLTEWEQKEIAAAMEAWGYSFDEAMDKQQRGYFTFYPNMDLEEVAEELVNECYTPDSATAEFFARYFDFSAFARDLRFDGYEETSLGVIVE